MHRSLSLLFALLFVIATVARAQTSACDEFPAQMRPTLIADAETSDYISVLAEWTPTDYRNFRGLLVEENLVRERYPLLTSVFFDAGRATIPGRYILMKDRAETIGFSDTVVPGGTLQKYYHLLNIIGYRLRTHPKATIEIVGCSSEEPALGETKELARGRAETIRQYLVEIWSIDRSRIRMLPGRGYPEVRSDPRNPTTNEENRRVEIRSKDWAITRPIVQQELRRYPQPEMLRYRMKDGIADELVARREIVITRGGQPWHALPVGVADSDSSEYNWGKGGDEMAIPTDEIPYHSQLVVYLKDGRICRSEIVETKVMIIDNERKIRERLVDKTIDRFSLVLFAFEKSTIDAHDERVLRELVVPSIQRGSKVNVIGYASAESSAEKLSEDRADSVADELRRRVRAGTFASMSSAGEGEAVWLYRGDLPEGRAYNRTVHVIITTPTGIEQ
jgi:outer membrane protein OmpA-like peptidoglycan-associated protein